MGQLDALSALKFLAISLKANNPNKDEQYREKYKEKLEKFIKHCNYPQQLRDEFERKEKSQGKICPNFRQLEIMGRREPPEAGRIVQSLLRQVPGIEWRSDLLLRVHKLTL